MGWSTAGAEQVVRKILAPLLGLGGFVYETAIHDGEPRWLIVSASLTLAIGGPLAQIFDSRGGGEAPRAPEPPVQPPSPTGLTGGQ